MSADNKQSISTGGGDDGETSLLDGSRTGKGSLRPEVYGTLDEASAFIGLARVKTALPRVKEGLLLFQNLIFRANSELACPPESRRLLKKPLTAKDVQAVTDIVTAIEERVQMPAKFVLYGELETSALLDVARAVVRRCERSLARLAGAETINPQITAFVNRLSDALYIMARLEERDASVPLRHPE
jgi:cob(I)alamin adenosyltransferase